MNIHLEPWSEEDLPLLQALLGDAEMMSDLGGPETPEQIRQRHARYLKLPDTDHIFKIIATDESKAVGSIGYWAKTWRNQQVSEMGWQVLRAYQGRGIATQAGELAIQQARAERRHPFMHAFPSVHNTASNAICRKLGFSLIEQCDFEYPPGNLMRCNDWRLVLFSG